MTACGWLIPEKPSAWRCCRNPDEPELKIVN